MRNSLLLASAVLLATACSDDDSSSPAAPNDGGHDAATSVDAGTDASSNIDASTNIDAAAQADASPTTDATVDATADASQQAPLAVIGRYHTEFGDEEITATTWAFGTIVEYDNSARVAYTQNPASASYMPGNFNKIVWTEPKDGTFYYCTVDFDGLTTLAAAKATTKVADTTNLESGCGGFPWSELSPLLAIAGTYTSGGDTVVISSGMLGANTIERYSNAEKYAVIGVTSGGDAGVSFYNRMLWTTTSASQLYICIVGDSFDTVDEAATSSATADAANLTTGCVDGPWTALTKQ